jgi:hypothetical protein
VAENQRVPAEEPEAEMKQRILYILAFKDEPLIKVGFSANTYVRSLQLGSELFNFSESYAVSAADRAFIPLLERNLKTFFVSHKTAASDPLPNGNTETFHSAALPMILKSIRAFAKGFPQARFQIKHDLSDFLPKQHHKRDPALEKIYTSGIMCASMAPSEIDKLMSELEAWCRAEYGRQRKLASVLGVSEQVVSHWIKRIRNPRLEHWIKLQEFLRKQRKPRKTTKA